MNTVSTRGLRRRFISAIWNSYSKSETARRPRTTARAPTWSMKSTSRPEKLSTRHSVGRRPSRGSTRSAPRRRTAGCLPLVAQHRHDHLVEQRTATLDDVEVAVVHGVERPGVDRDPLAHRSWAEVEGDDVMGGVGDPQQHQVARLAGCSISRVSVRPSSSPSAARTGFHSCALTLYNASRSGLAASLHRDPQALAASSFSDLHELRAACGRSPPDRSPARPPARSRDRSTAGRRRADGSGRSRRAATGRRSCSGLP